VPLAHVERSGDDPASLGHAAALDLLAAIERAGPA